MEKLFVGLFIFILGLVVSIYQAFVISLCWGWFVVKALNVEPIGIAIAYGLTLFVGLFYPLMVFDSEPKTQEEILKLILVRAIFVTATLICGWAAKAMFL